MRTTHTYALLEVSAAVYDEVEAKLRAAGYDHAFYEDSIQMQGIALKREVEQPQPLRERCCCACSPCLQGACNRCNQSNGWCANADPGSVTSAPEVARREDGAYTVGPPPDGRTVEEHCDELKKEPKRKRLPPDLEVSPPQLTNAVSLARDVLLGQQIPGCDVLRRSPDDASLTLIRALARALHTAATHVGRPTAVAEWIEEALTSNESA